MPLVTRSSIQGNFFKQDDEPAEWTDADLWADTNLTPDRGLYINNNGTALRLGTVSVDTTGSTVFVDTTAGLNIAPDRLSDPGTTYTTRASVTITAAENNSVVGIVGTCSCYLNAGPSRTDYLRVREGSTTVVSEVTNSRAVTEVEPILIIGTITGVTSGSHTYDLQHHLDTSGSTDFLFNATIGAVIVN